MTGAGLEEVTGFGSEAADRRLRRGGRVCADRRRSWPRGQRGPRARRRRSTRSADAGPEFRRSLSHRQTAWPRRHGRGVSSVGYRARRRGRGKGHQAGSQRGPGRGAGARAPLQAGAAPRAAGHAPQCGAHPRPRRDAGHQVHHDAVHPGRGPLDPAQARRQAPGSTHAEDCALDGLRPRRGARGGRGAPRPEAGQHHGHRGRRCPDHGLRHRALDDQQRAGGRRPAGDGRRCRRRRPDHARQRGRHHRIHGARTGAGAAGRSARRPVRLRSDPLRPAARPDAGRGHQQRVRRAQPPHARDAATGAHEGRVYSRGAGPHHHAVHSAGSRGAVCHDRGAGRRDRQAGRERQAAPHGAAAHAAADADVGARRAGAARADLVARARSRRAGRAGPDLGADCRLQQLGARQDVRRRARGRDRSPARRRIVHYLVSRSPGGAQARHAAERAQRDRRADGAADCRTRRHQGDSCRIDQPVRHRLPHHGQGREPRWQRAMDEVRELAHDQRHRRAKSGGRRGLRHPHRARRHRLAPGSAGRFRERDDQLPRGAAELHRRPGALRHRQVRRGRDGVQAVRQRRIRTSAAPMRAWPTRCSSWGARPRRKRTGRRRSR